MDSSEYLAFIPLLIYGLALADLFSEWKRLFDKEQWFFPYLLLTIIFTEVGIYNVFIYVKLVHQLVGQTYISYLSYLLPPFLFMMTINSFTPDKGSVTKDYFIKNMPIFLSLFTVFIACHFLFSFDETFLTISGRIIAMFFIFLTGITRKLWMVYVLTILWFILFFSRLEMITT
jgi:hypothetical protein